MAYNEYLEERLSIALSRKNLPFYKKKMFGGLAYMVDDCMSSY